MSSNIGGVLIAVIETEEISLSTCKLTGGHLRISETLNTGGKGVFTQQAHVEFIVSSETIFPANTSQVHAEYFLKVPTKVPPGYFVNVTLDFFHNSLTQVPTRYFVKETLGFFHKSLPKVPSRYFVKETFEFVHNVPCNVPIKEPKPPIKGSFKRCPPM
jgi:hypothetical protein